MSLPEGERPDGWPLDRIHGWIWWQVFWDWIRELSDQQLTALLDRSLATFAELVEAGEFQHEWDQAVAKVQARVGPRELSLLASIEKRQRTAARGQSRLGAGP